MMKQWNRTALLQIVAIRRRCISFALVPISFLLGCAEIGPRDCVCTMEYRSYVVHVRDASRHLIDSLQATSRNKRTGKTYTYNSGGLSSPLDTSGSYVVLADDASKDLSVAGDTILFHAQNAAHTVDGVFVFNTDECRCHIGKIAGPDTLTVTSADVR